MIKLNGREITIGHFPDETILMKCGADLLVGDKQKIEWRFKNNEEMVALMFLTKHIQSRGIKDIDLVLPYIPNARQDRVKSDEDIFTLKYFAEFINYLGFKHVFVLDPHSPVSEALINNVVVLQPDKIIADVIEDLEKIGATPTMMFYPDEGAMKRYSGMSELPYAFGIKNRDWKTGKIKGLDVAGSTKLINGATILIVDDICSRGGTFYHSAKKLRELGADKIFLYITHCEDSIFGGELLDSGLIDKVFTTDSIFTFENENIEVINLW